jgi:hypothetical protein
MSNEEITKALGLCFNINDNAGLNCGECPYKERTECSLNLYSDTINLINRQQARNKQLRDDLQKHMDAEKFLAKLTDEQQAEIERLTDRNKRLGEGVGWLLNNENGIELIRAEAIKEFAEELKKYSVEIVLGEKYKYKVVRHQGIDSIAERMVGADNENL